VTGGEYQWVMDILPAEFLEFSLAF
jgi:hypothetical protein